MTLTRRLLLVSISASTVWVIRYTSTPYLSWIAFLYFISIAFVHLITAFVYWGYIYPGFFSPLRHIPQPPGRSFLGGHTKAFISEPIGQTWRDWFDEFASNDYPVLRFMSLFNTERLIPIDPSAVADVLVHNCYDFEKPAFLKRNGVNLIGDGIVFAEGDVHKQQRKTLMPAFAYRKVKDLYPLFWERAGRMVKAIEEQGRREKAGEKRQDDVIVVETMEWASKAALSIIQEVALGVDLKAIEDPNETFSSCYREIMSPGRSKHVVAFLSMVLPTWIVRNLPISINRWLKRLKTSLRETCASQISLLISNKSSTATDLESTILGIVVSSQLFNLTDIVEQMKTFLVAGHETTATALAWAVYLLTQHPEMQKRLRDEIISAQLPLASSNSITAAQIDTLPYLNAFTSEVLRLYAPVPATVRESVRATSIAGYPVPAGTIVMLLPWAANTGTGNWGTHPDPRVFDPERWLQNGTGNGTGNSTGIGNGGAVSNYSSLTFLHGPRSCIGERFARGELACLLAAWVMRWETELVVEMEVDKQGNEKKKEIKVDLTSGITARPVGGVKVRLRNV